MLKSKDHAGKKLIKISGACELGCSESLQGCTKSGQQDKRRGDAIRELMRASANLKGPVKKQHF